MLSIEDCIVPDWPAPKGVRAIFTTRRGGVSVNTAQGELASLNLGKSVNDDMDAVNENRRRVATLIGHTPNWMGLVHGTDVAELDDIAVDAKVIADAAVARRQGVVCAVTMADCLPVLFTNIEGTVVAAAHAGWRGLAAGVLESTIAAMNVAPQSIMAYMGQAIGPEQFEVGEEVRAAFLQSLVNKAATDNHPAVRGELVEPHLQSTKSRIDNDALRQAQGERWDFSHFNSKNTSIDEAFQPFMAENTRKYWANIFLLARLRLIAAGIPATQIYGGGLCTVSDATRFFSYRREGKQGRHSGRMAALIWRE
jgi:polyphenol oxidase